jgi:biopolymer transport protein ExbB
VNVVEAFDLGGPLMWAILACSFVGLAFFMERLWALRRNSVLPPAVLEGLLAHIGAHDIQRAEQVCREQQSAICRVVESGLQSRPAGRAASKEAMEETGRIALARMEAGVGVLSTIAAIAPLLGLLGTVTGMIKVFRDVASTTNPDIQILATGIWEALLTTGAGLSVAIPCYVAYRFIEASIDRHGRDLEEAAVEILHTLFPTEPPSKLESE